MGEREETVKEALLYEKLSSDVASCHVCQRRCRIAEGDLGYCRTRVNRDGVLYSLTYGQVSTSLVAPIEVKPVHHYLPGSRAYSLGSLGCNFLCDGCQNYEISFALAEGSASPAHYVSPEDSVRIAMEKGCEGISWTYNEPTLWFEYTLDGAKAAKAFGLYTNYVTNGFMTMEALDTIGPHLDVFRVDIKAFEKRAYQKIAHIDNWEGILEVARRAKSHWNMHVEIVTNVIPGINDDPGMMRDLAQWIVSELGPGTPWHLTRFFPHWRMKDVAPTPRETLEMLRETGIKEGLTYVYIGNIPGHPANHTYCPSCKQILIERFDYDLVQSKLSANACPFCRWHIPGRFEGLDAA